MKKFLLWFGALLAVALCLLTLYGFLWIRQYQQMADEEPDIVLSPDVADVTYCSMEGHHRASPVYRVTSAAPPFLILHGELDDAVPVEQVRALHQEFINAGANSTLVIVKNANHNFKPTGGSIEPTRAEISDSIGDFFDHILQ